MARPSARRYTRVSDAKTEEVKRKVIEAQTKKREETQQQTSPRSDPQEIVAREEEKRIVEGGEQPVSKDIIFQQDIPRDELGVQEESDEYKTREKLEVPDWAEGNVLGDIMRTGAAFGTGLYAPTQQITQIPVDIARGVKAEDQTMMPTWLDLLIAPALQPAVMQKELGFTDKNWYSPLGQVEIWNKNTSLPAFAQDSGDKRDFLTGMADNLSILSTVLPHPEYHRIANEGLQFEGGGGIQGYQQLVTNEDSELRRNLPYYAGTVVGDIPYWVIAPMKAASAVGLAAKVSASTVRLAGKSTVSIKNINSVSKLGNAAEKVVKETRVNAKSQPKDGVRTTATDKAMKEIENNIDVRIASKERIISKLERDLKPTENKLNPKTRNEASVTQEQARLQTEVEYLKIVKRDKRIEYDTQVKNVQDAKTTWDKSKTDTNEANYMNQKNDYTEYVRNTFNPELKKMYNSQKKSIVDEYTNVRAERLGADQVKLNELKRTRNLLKGTEDYDTKRLASTEKKISELEVKMADPTYMPKAYQLANMIEKAPTEVHDWVKRKINPRYSVGADELEKINNPVETWSDGKGFRGLRQLAGVGYQLRNWREGVGNWYKRKPKEASELLATQLREPVIVIKSSKDTSKGIILKMSGDEARRMKSWQDNLLGDMTPGLVGPRRIGKYTAERKQLDQDYKDAMISRKTYDAGKMDIERRKTDELRAFQEKADEAQAKQNLESIEWDPELKKIMRSEEPSMRAGDFIRQRLELGDDLVASVEMVQPKVNLVQTSKNVFRGSIGEEVEVLAIKADPKQITAELASSEQMDKIFASGKLQSNTDITMGSRGKEWVFIASRADAAPELGQRGGNKAAGANWYVQVPDPKDLNEVQFINFASAVGLEFTPEMTAIGMRTLKTKKQMSNNKLRTVKTKEPKITPSTLEGKVLYKFKRFGVADMVKDESTKVNQKRLEKNVIGKDQKWIDEVDGDLIKNWIKKGRRDEDDVQVHLFIDKNLQGEKIYGPEVNISTIAKMREQFLGERTMYRAEQSLEELQKKKLKANEKLEEWEVRLEKHKKTVSDHEKSKDVKREAYASDTALSQRESESQKLQAWRAKEKSDMVEYRAIQKRHAVESEKDLLLLAEYNAQRYGETWGGKSVTTLEKGAEDAIIAATFKRLGITPDQTIDDITGMKPQEGVPEGMIERTKGPWTKDAQRYDLDPSQSSQGTPLKEGLSDADKLRVFEDAHSASFDEVLSEFEKNKPEYIKKFGKAEYESQIGKFTKLKENSMIRYNHYNDIFNTRNQSQKGQRWNDVLGQPLNREGIHDPWDLIRRTARADAGQRSGESFASLEKKIKMQQSQSEAGEYGLSRVPDRQDIIRDNYEFTNRIDEFTPEEQALWRKTDNELAYVSNDYRNYKGDTSLLRGESMIDDISDDMIGTDPEIAYRSSRAEDEMKSTNFESGSLEKFQANFEGQFKRTYSPNDIPQKIKDIEQGKFKVVKKKKRNEYGQVISEEVTGDTTTTRTGIKGTISEITQLKINIKKAKNESRNLGVKYESGINELLLKKKQQILVIEKAHKRDLDKYILVDDKGRPAVAMMDGTIVKSADKLGIEREARSKTMSEVRPKSRGGTDFMELQEKVSGIETRAITRQRESDAIRTKLWGGQSRGDYDSPMTVMGEPKRGLFSSFPRPVEGSFENRFGLDIGRRQVSVDNYIGELKQKISNYENLKTKLKDEASPASAIESEMKLKQAELKGTRNESMRKVVSDEIETLAKDLNVARKSESMLDDKILLDYNLNLSEVDFVIEKLKRNLRNKEHIKKYGDNTLIDKKADPDSVMYRNYAENRMMGGTGTTETKTTVKAAPHKDHGNLLLQVDKYLPEEQIGSNTMVKLFEDMQRVRTNRNPKGRKAVHNQEKRVSESIVKIKNYEDDWIPKKKAEIRRIDDEMRRAEIDMLEIEKAEEILKKSVSGAIGIKKGRLTYFSERSLRREGTKKQDSIDYFEVDVGNTKGFKFQVARVPTKYRDEDGKMVDASIELNQLETLLQLQKEKHLKTDGPRTRANALWDKRADILEELEEYGVKRVQGKWDGAPEPNRPNVKGQVIIDHDSKLTDFFADPSNFKGGKVEFTKTQKGNIRALVREHDEVMHAIGITDKKVMRGIDDVNPNEVAIEKTQNKLTELRQSNKMEYKIVDYERKMDGQEKIPGLYPEGEGVTENVAYMDNDFIRNNPTYISERFGDHIVTAADPEKALKRRILKTEGKKTSGVQEKLEGMYSNLVADVRTIPAGRLSKTKSQRVKETIGIASMKLGQRLTNDFSLEINKLQNTGIRSVRVSGGPWIAGPAKMVSGTEDVMWQPTVWKDYPLSRILMTDEREINLAVASRMNQDAKEFKQYMTLKKKLGLDGGRVKGVRTKGGKDTRDFARLKQLDEKYKDYKPDQLDGQSWSLARLDIPSGVKVKNVIEFAPTVPSKEERAWGILERIARERDKKKYLDPDKVFKQDTDIFREWAAFENSVGQMDTQGSLVNRTEQSRQLRFNLLRQFYESGIGRKGEQLMQRKDVMSKAKKHSKLNDNGTYTREFKDVLEQIRSNPNSIREATALDIWSQKKLSDIKLRKKTEYTDEEKITFAKGFETKKLGSPEIGKDGSIKNEGFINLRELGMGTSLDIWSSGKKTRTKEKIINLTADLAKKYGKGQDSAYPLEKDPRYRLFYKLQLREYIKDNPWMLKKLSRDDKKIYNEGERPLTAEELSVYRADLSETELGKALRQPGEASPEWVPVEGRDVFSHTEKIMKDKFNLGEGIGGTKAEKVRVKDQFSPREETRELVQDELDIDGFQPKYFVRDEKTGEVRIEVDPDDFQAGLRRGDLTRGLEDGVSIDDVRAEVTNKMTDVERSAIGPVNRQGKIFQSNEEMIDTAKLDIESRYPGGSFQRALQTQQRSVLMEQFENIIQENTDLQQKTRTAKTTKERDQLNEKITSNNQSLQEIDNILKQDSALKNELNEKWFAHIDLQSEVTPSGYVPPSYMPGVYNAPLFGGAAYATTVSSQPIPEIQAASEELKTAEFTLPSMVQSQSPVQISPQAISLNKAREVIQTGKLELPTLQSLRTDTEITAGQIIRPLQGLRIEGLQEQLGKQEVIPALGIVQALQYQLAGYDRAIPKQAPKLLPRPMEAPRLPIPPKRPGPVPYGELPQWIVAGWDNPYSKKQKNRKKRKTYWDVPDEWYKPGYWAKKKDESTGKWDRVGSGYTTFKGAEPRRARKSKDKFDLY